VLGVPDKLGEELVEAERVELSDALGLKEAVALRDGERLDFPLRVAKLGEDDTEATPEKVSDTLTEEETESVETGVGETEAISDRVPLELDENVTLTLPLRVPLSDGEPAREGDGAGVLETDGNRDRELSELEEKEAHELPLGLGRSVVVWLAHSVLELDGIPEGEARDEEDAHSEGDKETVVDKEGFPDAVMETLTLALREKMLFVGVDVLTLLSVAETETEPQRVTEEETEEDVDKNSEAEAERDTEDEVLTVLLDESNGVHVEETDREGRRDTVPLVVVDTVTVWLREKLAHGEGEELNTPLKEEEPETDIVTLGVLVMSGVEVREKYVLEEGGRVDETLAETTSDAVTLIEPEALEKGDADEVTVRTAEGVEEGLGDALSDDSPLSDGDTEGEYETESDTHRVALLQYDTDTVADTDREEEAQREGIDDALDDTEKDKVLHGEEDVERLGKNDDEYVEEGVRDTDTQADTLKERDGVEQGENVMEIVEDGETERDAEVLPKDVTERDALPV
jgi:hypothetical protein